ncbi:methionine aminopeptidase 1D, mitochondrial-like [Physella acuta]|uniref:methionine aminopeptidase 1D, mitochondrial-like n=1 Tax=Physella acuta TaxID=109671 RepID=UPI0027DCC0D9|nr:methionine aminopeptidase 1D, mitochondrial-like [Physella acuta]XP_059151197.1 methionine aminopeptidase 1D, mitochondrial-like [Physella acuta]
MAMQFEKIITKYLCSKSFGSIRNIFGPSKAWNTYQAPKSTTTLANYDLPKSLPLPPYVTCGEFRAPTSAEIKTNEQINQMRPACKLAASILQFVGENIKVGMTTNDIDALVYTKCIEAGAYPSPLNYKGFPKCVCTSVNEVACHGIPGNLVLKDGDIINVDITVFYNGYHGDTSHTFMVGDVDKRGKALVKAAEKCRDAGIGVCHNGALISDIGDIIYSTAVDAGFEVLPYFCGHGIGHYFHGPPDIVHVPSDFVGDQKMLTGMTFTIEPIVCDGTPEIKILEDGWTVVTVDGSRSAQFEHTILITDNGCEILT